MLRGRVGVAHLVLPVVVGRRVVGVRLARELGNTNDGVGHGVGAVGNKRERKTAASCTIPKGAHTKFRGLAKLGS